MLPMLSILLSALATARQDDVALWAPVRGEHVEWRWSRQQSRELMSTAVSTGDDTELDLLEMTDVPHAVQDSLELRVLDRIVERNEFAPLQLERFVLHARRTTCSQWGTGLWLDELATESLFEESFLVFARDAASDTPLVRHAASARVPAEYLDETLLAGLAEPLDLRTLLGGAPRRPGDGWPLVTEDLLPLARPGGELAFGALEADIDQDHSSVVLGWMLGAAPISGRGRAEGRAVYRRAEQEDGVRVACIALHGTIETGGPMWVELEHLESTADVVRSDLGFFEQAAVEHTIHLEGELLWDLDAHRAHALEIEAECRSRMTATISLWGTQEYIEEWRGELHLRVSARIVE